MKLVLLLACICSFSLAGCSQNDNSPKENAHVGGECEGCEAVYESPVPFDSLTMYAWLPDWDTSLPRIAINGTVYNPDGTPAPGVIVYIYHTDQSGIYPKKGDEKGWAKRHGYLRGWMKTNEKGEYKFFTRRPASYPGSKNPQHIHVIIKEPGKIAYWIDDYLFDDDPLLTAEERQKCRNRGGSDILKISDYYKGRNILKSERNIYLGRNIPGYVQHEKHSHDINPCITYYRNLPGTKNSLYAKENCTGNIFINSFISFLPGQDDARVALEIRKGFRTRHFKRRQICIVFRQHAGCGSK